MRVGINAHKLSFESGFRQAGTSRYIEALLQQLPGVANDDDEIFAFTGKVPNDWVQRFPSRIEWRMSRLRTAWPPARILWEQSAGLGLGRRMGLDLMHCPLNVAPLAPGTPTIVTVHDIAFERFPNHYPPGQTKYLSKMTRLSTRRAEHVIAVSQSTKDDLVRYYAIAPSNITVVYNGIDAEFRERTPAELDAFRATASLPPDFILFVGTLQPRKNLDGLLRAFAYVADRLDWPLIVIGGAGWLYGPIGRLVKQLGLVDRVRFQGYVDPADLPSWYAAATIFALPSHYEGFGLPVAEAMASGTPVVTSSTSSLPEVAGDAAVLVDPTSPVEIARGILQLAEDEELRRELTTRGLRQAGRFTWRKAAAETYAVYRQVDSQYNRGHDGP